MRRNAYIIIIVLIFVLVGVSRCGGSSSKAATNSSIDEMVEGLSGYTTFSIMLADMDVDGVFFKEYRHQYRILKEKNDVFTQSNTGWVVVSEEFYKQNKNNLGMVMAAKGNAGKVNKEVSPPGYANYVGNPKYGQWRERSNGTSFWEFYGKYAMLSTVFNMFNRPVYRNYYDDYRGNYYGSGRTYYGSRNGRSYYGSNSTWSKNTSYGNRFKQRVNSRVNRSSGSSKYSRSSSRYRSRSSMRSRSGGFGK